MDSLEEKIKDAFKQISFGANGGNILDSDVVYSLEIEKESKGRSWETAKENADNIDYSFRILDNRLILDPYYSVNLENKWRFPRVETTIPIPEGKVLVLDFWASWCVPCRRSFPWMNQMQQKYSDDGLVIIAVNLDKHASDGMSFLEAYPADFTIAYDNERQLAHEYKVQAMPSSFLIDRNGAVIESHLGFKVAKTDAYEAAIVSALGIKP